MISVRSIVFILGVVPSDADAGAAEPETTSYTLVDARQVSDRRPGHSAAPVFSRDGKRLAWERWIVDEEVIEIDVVDDLASPQERVVRPKVGESNGGGGANDWLRTFQREADRAGLELNPTRPGQVCRDVAWGPLDAPAMMIYSCNARGYQLFVADGAQMTDGSGNAGQPAFSPVGASLVFVVAEHGPGDLVLDVPSSGSSSARERKPALPPGPLRIQPRWSHRGDAIAYVEFGRDGEDVFVVKHPGDSAAIVTNISRRRGADFAPSFSPDDARVAFFGTGKATGKGGGNARYHLFVAPSDGSATPRRIASDVVPSKTGPAWTPDGKGLLFVKRDRARHDPIFLAPLAAGEPPVLIPTETLSHADVTIAVDAGRWQIAFSALSNRRDSRTWRGIHVATLETAVTRTPGARRPREHKVISKETLWSIAKKYGVSVKSLRRENHLNSGRVAVGKVLVIPSRRAPKSGGSYPKKKGP